MSTYSEYNASRIEMLYTLGYTNIKYVHKINLDNIVRNDENIRQSYVRDLGDVMTIIDNSHNCYFNLKAEEYYLKYKQFLVKSMYYFGKTYICNEVSDKREPDITEKSFGEFYPFMENLIASFHKIDCNKILVVENLLWKFFLAYFPNKNKNHLLSIV